MLSTETFRENLSRIRDRIGAATRKCGRAPEDITLIGVSKRKPLTDLITAVDNGLADIGENRIQEAREKLPGLEDRPVRRHLIGHSQKTQARLVAHTWIVYSLRLAACLPLAALGAWIFSLTPDEKARLMPTRLIALASGESVH